MERFDIKAIVRNQHIAHSRASQSCDIMISLSTMFDFALETPVSGTTSSILAFEITLILFSATLAAAVIVFVKSRGRLRLPRHKGSMAASVKMTFAPATEQATAVGPAASWLAPSPSPASYETVQPKPAPGGGQFSTSSWTALGDSTAAPRRTTSYRRRTIPTRSTATKDQSEKSSG